MFNPERRECFKDGVRFPIQMLSCSKGSSTEIKRVYRRGPDKQNTPPKKNTEVMRLHQDTVQQIRTASTTARGTTTLKLHPNRTQPHRKGTGTTSQQWTALRKTAHPLSEECRRRRSPHAENSPVPLPPQAHSTTTTTTRTMALDRPR